MSLGACTCITLRFDHPNLGRQLRAITEVVKIGSVPHCVGWGSSLVRPLAKLPWAVRCRPWREYAIVLSFLFLSNVRHSHDIVGCIGQPVLRSKTKFGCIANESMSGSAGGYPVTVGRRCFLVDCARHNAISLLCHTLARSRAPTGSVLATHGVSEGAVLRSQTGCSVSCPEIYCCWLGRTQAPGPMTLLFEAQ